MTVKELKEYLQDIPDDAKVIVWAEAACHYEKAKVLIATRDKVDSEGDVENAIYEYGGWECVYDKCEVDKYPVDGKITGVLLSS